MRAEREDFVVAAIERGVGITMMPKKSAELAGLATCEVENQMSQRDICFVTVKDRPKPPFVSELSSLISN